MMHHAGYRLYAACYIYFIFSFNSVSVCGGNIFYEAANEMGAAPKRLSGKIEVNFTERVFPTPVRESTAQAEEEVSEFFASEVNAKETSREQCRTSKSTFQGSNIV